MNQLRELLRLNWHGDERVSDSWLKAQDRTADRVEYHGVSIQWPIKKAINESAKWNAKRLRNRA